MTWALWTVWCFAISFGLDWFRLIRRCRWLQREAHSAEREAEIARQGRCCAERELIRQGNLTAAEQKRIHRIQRAIDGLLGAQMFANRNCTEQVSEEYLMRFTLLEHAAGLRGADDDIVQIAQAWAVRQDHHS